MGLDMYLYVEKYVSGWDFRKDPTYDQLVTMYSAQKFITTESPSATVSFCCVYWRKANAVHRWFVENVQDNKDDCDRYYVERDQLRELYSKCEEILAHPQRAGVVLPSQAGFFFGSTEYDEWYMHDIEYTRNAMARVLENVPAEDTLDGWTFYYQASW